MTLKTATPVAARLASAPLPVSDASRYRCDGLGSCCNCLLLGQDARAGKRLSKHLIRDRRMVTLAAQERKTTVLDQEDQTRPRCSTVYHRSKTRQIYRPS